MDTLSGVVFSSSWAVELWSPAIFDTSVTAFSLSLASSRSNGGGLVRFAGTVGFCRRRRTQNTHKLRTPISPVPGARRVDAEQTHMGAMNRTTKTGTRKPRAVVDIGEVPCPFQLRLVSEAVTRASTASARRAIAGILALWRRPLASTLCAGQAM